MMLLSLIRIFWWDELVVIGKGHNLAERRVLARLLRLRELEEEQSRTELEAAVGVRNRVRVELAEVSDRQTLGRRNFATGIAARDPLGRTGAMMELERAREQQVKIRTRFDASEAEVARQREEFLLRRTERRQVETLVDDQQAMDVIETARRAQQMLDDWYGRRGTKETARGLSASAKNPLAGVLSSGTDTES